MNQAIKYISRWIIYFLKKYNLEKPDHRRSLFEKKLYLLRNSEWKNIEKNSVSKEMDSRYFSFDFFVKINYKWKSVEMGIDDLTWLLGYNRFWINTNCKGRWYYENEKYHFESSWDKMYFEYHARKFNFLKEQL